MVYDESMTPKLLTSLPTGHKVPRVSTSSRVAKALAKVPRDGQWYAILEAAMSSAEQIARQHNHDGAQWEFGYYLETDPSSGEISSVLTVRST